MERDTHGILLIILRYSMKLVATALSESGEEGAQPPNRARWRSVLGGHTLARIVIEGDPTHQRILLNIILSGETVTGAGTTAAGPPNPGRTAELRNLCVTSAILLLCREN